MKFTQPLGDKRWSRKDQTLYNLSVKVGLSVNYSVGQQGFTYLYDNIYLHITYVSHSIHNVLAADDIYACLGKIVVVLISCE